MEKLRRFAKRLLGANEKLVFALMVGVLIWRVVQIVYTPPPPPTTAPPPVIPFGDEEKKAPPMKTSRQDPARFANVSVARWTVPGMGEVVKETEPDDAGLPSITCEGTQEIGSNTGVFWAKILVDGKPELVRPGSYFANRRAKLDKLDANGKKFMFTWVGTGRQYERPIAG